MTLAQEIGEFIKNNWALALGTTIIVAPVAYGIAKHFLRERIEEGEAARKKIQAELDLCKAGKSPAIANPRQVFPLVTPESQQDLIARLEGAKKQIRIFGLTRNFYARDDMQKLILKKAQEVPVKFFIMDPDCKSREDRYRVEPIGAAMYDRNHYRATIEKVFVAMLRRSPQALPRKDKAGLSFHYFNFPCQFAAEQFDNTCRISIYGLHCQGRESPIWVYEKGDREYEYFVSQLDWVEGLAAGETSDETIDHQLKVLPLVPPSESPPPFTSAPRP